ncbi:adenosylcobinamide-GDP ribazoletransferase [Undibacterium sp. Di27W]|uniref:adenosylcobinamide-GDP ribazoletransferase n=1 Tax=Undibacterium sp. Di27W TaxID=3413036 RepID=UPI003BEF632A
MHQLRLFLIALQFFTRIPIPAWVGFEPDWLRQSSRYFPATGWIVGAVCAAVYVAAAQLWPHAVAVLLSTIAGILLTGAFHEDGFADVCDGFGGGMTPERVLEIMKDSRVGAYGAIGIFLVLACKLTLLISLPARLVLPALLLAHPLSRLASCSLIWRMRYARHEGKAKPLAQEMHAAEFLIASLTVLLPAALLLYYFPVPLKTLLLAMALLFLLTWRMAHMFQRRIAGFTGDCLGATQQVAELAIYLGLLAFQVP